MSARTSVPMGTGLSRPPPRCEAPPLGAPDDPPPKVGATGIPPRGRGHSSHSSFFETQFWRQCHPILLRNDPLDLATLALGLVVGLRVYPKRRLCQRPILDVVHRSRIAITKQTWEPGRTPWSEWANSAQSPLELAQERENQGRDTQKPGSHRGNLGPNSSRIWPTSGDSGPTLADAARIRLIPGQLGRSLRSCTARLPGRYSNTGLRSWGSARGLHRHHTSQSGDPRARTPHAERPAAVELRASVELEVAELHREDIVGAPMLRPPDRHLDHDLCRNTTRMRGALARACARPGSASAITITIPITVTVIAVAATVTIAIAIAGTTSTATPATAAGSTPTTADAAAAECCCC